jgi:outer membrane protein insertion porin family
MRLSGPAVAALAVAMLSTSAQAQRDRCVVPDSIRIEGNRRVSDAIVRGDAGVSVGDTLDFGAVQRIQKNLFITSEYDSVSLSCVVTGAERRSVLVISVVERPRIGTVEIQGARNISDRQIRDKLLLVSGRTADPAAITRARVAVDSMYRSKSYYLARVVVDSSEGPNGLDLVFRVDEGRRLAISGISIEGNDKISDSDIVAGMATRPEGFLWTRGGEFDDVLFQMDLADSIPRLYANRGFIDLRIVRDTLIIDPEIGKAMIVIEVEEGPQYKVESFEIVGNRYFQSAELQPMFPFRERSPTLGEHIRSVLGSEILPHDVFNQSRWDEATRQLWSRYQNEGFRDAEINPVVERGTLADSTHVVKLRWEINERSQAIINRIDIVGNTYTVESCIRQSLRFYPGSVYSEDRIIQTMQSLQASGLFEDPIPIPRFETVDDSLGLLNVTFSLTEKKTGSINFGASMGGVGGGLGGFVGFDQPNLFGKCKHGTLNWQFGSLVKEFSLSYSDPSIRKSIFSGSVDLYHLRSRYVVADFGRQTRAGGSFRLGFPLLDFLATRGFVSYGAERVKYSRDESLLGQLADLCDNCLRSTFGMNVTRDTRLGLPFALQGVYQTFDAQLNGGPLGGTADFQRYTTDFRSFVPLGQAGGDPLTGLGAIRFVLGLSLRTGLVFGNTGPFFPYQEFAMGGVQQGEPLRGYDEFTITPDGYVIEGSALQARRESFGRAYMSSTVELGARLSQTVYASLFFDAGNVWRQPRDFNPGRMFRGAGVGIALVTPLGPLGLDYAYGFDKLDRFGRPDPGWQLHFKLGQIY